MKLATAVPGEKYPHGDFNQIKDVAEQLINNGFGGNRSGGTAPPPGMAFVRVKNLSGEDLTKSFGVLRITGPLYDHENVADQRISALNGGVELKGEKPNDEEDQITCIVQQALPKNALGRAIITGTTAVLLDVKDKNHKYAKPVKDDVTKLQTADSGPWRIVNPLESTGEQIGYVCPAGGSSESKSMVKDVLAETLAYNQTARTQGGRTVKCPELELTYSYLPTGKTVYLMPVDGDPQVEWYVVWASNLNLGIKLGPPNFTYTEPNTWTATADTYLAGAGTSYAEDLGLSVDIFMGIPGISATKVASGWPIATYTFDSASTTSGNIYTQISSTRNDIENSDIIESTIVPITANPKPGATAATGTQVLSTAKIALVPETLPQINLYYRWEDESFYRIYSPTTKITPKPTGTIGIGLWVGSQRIDLGSQWIRDARRIGYYRTVER